MRLLLAIGCNKYEEAQELQGAESDAERIFNALVRQGSSWYDPMGSLLLLSPTLDSVRIALRDILFKRPAIETFTFYFAGHGGVHAGSFYMWLRDTMQTGQSVSALALADLFRNINEAAPRQTNIVIDACESGGLVEDLGVLLKPELLGDAGTPAITLVATAARNQTAGEMCVGGFGTNAILDCIEGREFVNDTSSALDLVEISRKVSIKLQPLGQNPVVWGLNLYGAPSFCGNPRYNHDGMAPLRDMVQAWPVEADSVIRENHSRLWALYTSLNGDWDQEKFQNVIRAIVQSPELSPEQAARVSERLAATFLQSAAQSDDPYRSVLVVAALAASLLPLVAARDAEASARRLLCLATEALHQANAALIADLTADRFALLSAKAGLADLYFLPLRISKVLGWAAAASFMCQTDDDRQRADAQFKEMLALILEHYAPSIVALNDVQAPAWCVALKQAATLGLKDEGEQLAGLIFHSLTSVSGRVARWNLNPNDALEYLLARSSDDFSTSPELVERPIETLTVLLRAAHLFELEEVFDEALWRLDGVNFSAYIPSDLNQFNADTMRGGLNLVWTIGHDVCQTREFTSVWPTEMPSPADSLIRALVVVSALLLPNRQPWFLLEAEAN